MAKYNGHPSWAHWNVSLWIGNDEGLYATARECIRSTRNRKAAATLMLGTLRDSGITQTPDGANYTVTMIMHAMRGL